jgi:hypothetical protein
MKFKMNLLYLYRNEIGNTIIYREPTKLKNVAIYIYIYIQWWTQYRNEWLVGWLAIDG